MIRALWVGVAGAAGAMSRYGIGLLVGPQAFPWATLGINLSGSFLFAFVVTWALQGHLSRDAATAVAAGFLGAYTTYSAFSFELFDLGRTGRGAVAVTYAAVSLAGGLVAAWAGYRLGQALA